MISAVPPPWTGLTALFGAAGLAHLLRPAGFDAIVPRALPGPPRAWTIGSGVAELALAVGFAVPATRRATGTAAAAFLLAVWPANVKMALDRPGAVTFARLPLQVPLIRWAYRAGR